MTKEQELEIKEAIAKYYPPNTTFTEAIFVGIKAYDELQNETEESSSNDSYVVFRPLDSIFGSPLKTIRVFHNKDEMVKTLSEEHPGYKVVISGDVYTDSYMHWEDCRLVRADSAFGFYNIGICDCTTFRKG